MIERGAGCRVWDLDGDEYVEFGAGLRSVTLGHGFEPVMDAGSPTVSRGATFILPSPISPCGHGHARCRGSHVSQLRRQHQGNRDGPLLPARTRPVQEHDEA